MTQNTKHARPESEFRQILGVTFFVGGAQRAIDILRKGGLLVVPSAPGLKSLQEDIAYREALLGADLAIADSALMVMLWNFMQKDRIRRLSGLAYLVELLAQPEFREPGGSFWIMAGPESARKNMAWLNQRGIEVLPQDIYIAPMYASPIEDKALLKQIHNRKPAHVIVTIGGGTQERLGLYLKQNLESLPAIHCIGAAIAFLSGDQVHIPMWADRFYLGWLFRCIWKPKRFVPRYWSARKLIRLMVRYRGLLPIATAKQA
jgi:UDP-N-acetyl-D-mannosaminuronic acid transferase (WecB/TagA/CpsF family)